MAQYHALDFRHGKTLYASKSDIVHKLEMGCLFDVFYDTETTDLDKRFAEIIQFGGVVTDLAGNILHTANYRAKPSDYNVISPVAWEVQGLTREKLEGGDPQYIFAGKVMQFFRQASRLDQAPFQNTFLKMCRPGTFHFSDGHTEEYYAYPVWDDENNAIDWDCVRIHENLKKFYYCDPKTGEWHKRNIMAMDYGYNNVNADDQWIWTMLHMAGARNIFATHLTKEGKLRSDLLRMVESVVAAGPKGENGVKPGQKKDDKTGLMVPSFSEGDILEANTRMGNALRDIAEGVTLPDGSLIDRTQLHDALKDTFPLPGLLRFLRQAAPDIVRQSEQNANWKHVVERASEKSGGFGDHPIQSYIDKSFPDLTGMMVSLIGTDQYRHNPKVAVMFNLGIDPETFHYKNKKLTELSPKEHQRLIENSKNNPSGLYKIIRTHHSPRLFDQKTGFQAGFNNGLYLQELQKRAKFLQRHPDLRDNIMKGYRLAEPRQSQLDRLILPQPEEELFTFSTLEMFDPEIGQDVQIHNVESPVEAMARDSRDHVMKVKGFWLQAIEPDEDILLDDFGKDAGAEYEAALEFTKKIKALNKKLREHNGPKLPEADHHVTNRKTALAYKIKLLFYARNHFLSGELQDIGHHFWFEDAHGVCTPNEDIKSWSQARLDEERKAGNLHLQHEQLYITAPIIDRIIDSLGYGHILGPDVQKQLDAMKAIRTWGIPAHNGKDRWMTIPESERLIQKIKHNELLDEDLAPLEKRKAGAWAKFVSSHNVSQHSLNEYIAYQDNRAQSAPHFTPELMTLAGINPVTGAAKRKRDYIVDFNNAAKIKAPDRYLENPVRDPITRNLLFLLPVCEEWNAQNLQDCIKNGQDIILQGRANGKSYHLPKARLIDVPQRGGPWEKTYKIAHNLYAESAMQLPGDHQLFALTGEGPYALHALRDVDTSAQTLHVETSHFEGLLDHKFAGYAAPLSGILVRDEALKPKRGPVRLLEFDTDQQSPTGWEVTAHITEARDLSMADLEELDDHQAAIYGYPTAGALSDYVRTLFASQQLDPGDPTSTIWTIDFAGISAFDPQTGTIFYNPEIMPISGCADAFDLPSFEL